MRLYVHIYFTNALFWYCGITSAVDYCSLISKGISPIDASRAAFAFCKLKVHNLVPYHSPSIIWNTPKVFHSSTLFKRPEVNSCSNSCLGIVTKCDHERCAYTFLYIYTVDFGLRESIITRFCIQHDELERQHIYRALHLNYHTKGHF